MSRHSPKEIERIKRIAAKMNPNPELIIKSQPIDLELCELLGEKASDFIVLCFNGVQMEDFGTPYDTPRNRVERQGLVERLNDRSADSLWPELWREWKPNICKQFGLPTTTEAHEYTPVVSWKISRVCPGYSEHLHCAIHLFEKVADKIIRWEVTQALDCRASVIDKRSRTFLHIGGNMPRVIAETIRELLMANQDNTELCDAAEPQATNNDQSATRQRSQQ